MLPHPRQLDYFELEPSRYPFRDWLLALADAKTRHRLEARLRKLELGNPGEWRAVGGGVIELKEHFGPGYRLYIGEDGPVLVILLAGGTKAGQARDIRLAQEYWSLYRARKAKR